jgi:hypothetical protein
MSDAPKTEYELWILRNDERHILVGVSEDFEKLYETWKELHSKWKGCSDENAPYILEDPIVTAFNPILIKEIILTIKESNRQISSNNPYERRMQEHGFGNSRPPVDLLDGGYR